jgi:hypothetical protein
MASITLTIEFDGQSPTKTQTFPTFPAVLTIVPVGGQLVGLNYVISPRVAGVAVTLEAALDANNDTLTLKNMKIAKNAGAWPDLHITIKGENKYELIPSAIPPGAPVQYRVSASGSFKRGAGAIAVGSYLKTRGYQRNPSPNGTLYWLGSNPPSALNGKEINHTVTNNNTLPGNYEAHTDWIANLAATRDLHAQCWVKLNNNADTFSLTELKVFNTTAGKGDEKSDSGDSERRTSSRKKK